MQNKITEPGHYEELVARQIDQYKETEVMHDLPSIYRYWSKKYTNDQSSSVTGCTDVVGLYATYFRKSLQESDSIFLVSIGSGDCSIEIQIVKKLLETGERFFFICLELSPILIAKARQLIDAESLGDVITVAQIDLNKWQPKNSFAGVMAHHALHHFLNLEELFGLIRKNLAKHGRFVTCDIIGRNGHMRWPEALLLTRKIWEGLPRKYKYNHQFKQYEDYFNNFDCSTEGFEGIRAQDILPLLVTLFSFEVFFCYGNLIDPFVDRTFGPNYDPDNPGDAAFIDYVQELNEKLISEGTLKPTSMIAVMVNEPVANPKIYANRDPFFALRDPKAQAPVYNIDVLLQSMPLRAGKEDHPFVVNQVRPYPLGRKAVFSSSETLPDNSINGNNYLTYGWAYPEAGYTWSNCEDAAILFPLETATTGALTLTLEFLPYQSSLYEHTLVKIAVNGADIQVLQYDNAIPARFSSTTIRLPKELVAGRTEIEVSFLFPTRRQPQFESGDDRRSVGIALASATLSPGRT
jgi:SAM-dependent methyltransferase